MDTLLRRGIIILKIIIDEGIDIMSITYHMWLSISTKKVHTKSLKYQAKVKGLMKLVQIHVHHRTSVSRVRLAGVTIGS